MIKLGVLLMVLLIVVCLAPKSVKANDLGPTSCIGCLGLPIIEKWIHQHKIKNCIKKLREKRNNNAEEVYTDLYESQTLEKNSILRYIILL